MQVKNYGLVLPDIKTREQGAEHLLGAERPIINPSGDWSNWLSPAEPQSKNGVETKNCTGYGTCHAIETQVNFLTKKTVNYSERYLGIEAGTLPFGGNDPHTVAETWRRTSGAIPEDELTFTDDIKTPQEYYLPKPPPQRMIDDGQKWYDAWELQHEWVFIGGDPASKKGLLQQALRRGTVCVSVRAWERNAQGIFVKPEGAVDTHWTTLVKYDNDGYPIVFDSYDSFIKKLDQNYDFGVAKVYYLSPAEPKLSILQQILYLISKIITLDFLLRPKTT